MNKKNYEKAAAIVRSQRDTMGDGFEATIQMIMQCFIELFKDDNSRFDEERFIEACRPRCDKLTHRFSDKGCTKHEGHEGKCS